MIASALCLCVFTSYQQVDKKSEVGVFTVEIVASAPKKAGSEIQLALGRGFVDRDGGKISNRRLKEVYLAPDPKQEECVLRIQFHQSDKEKITLDYLFKHIDTIRELRPKNVNTYIYVIVN